MENEEKKQNPANPAIPANEDTRLSVMPRQISSPSSSDLLTLPTQNRAQPFVPFFHDYNFIRPLIGKFCGDAHLIRQLSRVNSSFRKSTAIEREKIALDQLLLAVVRGEQDKVEKILQLYPQFLLNKTGTATDYSGRMIANLTPFQAALCAGDLEMCAMMKNYFLNSNKILDGQAALNAQFNEIFPGGLEIHTKKQAQAGFNFYDTQLQDIFEAIRTAPANEIMEALNKNFDADTALNKALKEFRRQFDEKSHSDKVFNPEYVLAAFKSYNDNFDALTNCYKRGLFWRQVVGYTQRYFSACHAQAFAQGLYYINEGEDRKRTMDFRHGGGAIFPLNVTPELGYDCGAGGLEGAGGDGRQPTWRWRWATTAAPAKVYVRQLPQAWKDYERTTTAGLERLRTNDTRKRHISAV